MGNPSNARTGWSCIRWNTCLQTPLLNTLICYSDILSFIFINTCLWKQLFDTLQMLLWHFIIEQHRPFENITGHPQMSTLKWTPSTVLVTVTFYHLFLSIHAFGNHCWTHTTVTLTFLNWTTQNVWKRHWPPSNEHL